jgi:hypothetical protein
MIEEIVTYLSTTGSATSIVMLKDWSCRLWSGESGLTGEAGGVGEAGGSAAI